MNWDDGCKYEGDWKDDVRHGKGVFEYTNGDKYDGDWADDIQHGRGTYYFHTGDRYEGSYLLGEPVSYTHLDVYKRQGVGEGY